MAALPMAPWVARAQAPFAFQGPITIVAPFPPGGSTDLLARLVAERMAESLGRPVIVENQAGAGGRIAARSVQSAAPDGSRLLLANTSVMVLTPLAFADAGYDPLGGFTPIHGAAEFAAGLATGPMTGAGDLAALTAWLRARPTEANFGVPALGSLPHLTGIAYSRAISLPFTVVPYRGGAPIAQDLAGGRVAMGIAAAADFATLHQGGRLKLVAVTGTARAPGLADVGTFAEQGLAGFEANAWNGFFGPANMPAPVVAALSSAIARALADPVLRERLLQVALTATPVQGPVVAGWITRDRATYAPLIAAAGPLSN
jgi:tripartite-type tricarboxylate transporter receptor subunit TctC